MKNACIPKQDEDVDDEKSQFFNLFGYIVFLICLFIPSLIYSNDREIGSAYMHLFSHEFGYTLIEEKAISAEEIVLPYFGLSPEQLKKFIHSLSTVFNGSEKFIFKVFPSDRGCNIELIHEKALKNLIFKNMRVRHFINSKFQDANEFCEKLKDPKVSIFTIFDDEIVRGIVLGYGETNSRYYYRRILVGTYLKKFPIVNFYPPPITQFAQCVCTFPYADTHSKPITSFPSLESEWEWMQKNFWNTEKESEIVPPYLIALPCYLSRHGGDSEKLREKYKKARERLASLFYNRSIQDAVAEEAAKK